MPSRPSYRSILRSITLLLLDVDGVLTDGRITYSDDGRESKSFHVRDGYGIVTLRRQGCRVGIITGRSSAAVTRRAQELGIDDVLQGVGDKLQVYESLKRKYGLDDREIAYIGDDGPDMEVLRRAGFSAAPADAHETVQKVVMYVCTRKGGEGAVREVTDMILEAQSNPQRGQKR